MTQLISVKGMYGIVPSPCLPQGDQLGSVATVDIDATADMLESLIVDGVDGLIALGTTGECATLSSDDYFTFVDTVLSVVDRRVPTFMGVSALGGHEVAARMRFVAAHGGDGVLLGLPQWQPVSDEMAVDFFRSISETFPELAVMVYANSRAFRYDFPLEFWRDVSNVAPTVVAAKYSRPKDLSALLAITEGKINIVPNESTATHFFASSPETTTAMWATAAAMGPAPVIALMRAIDHRMEAEIESISADIQWANETVKPIFGDPKVFATYNLQMEKGRINAAGYCHCGPCRPPYNHLPQDYAEAARECGQRWRVLQAKYSDRVA